MNLTFDTNCIITLEENRPAAPDLKSLIALHNAQAINVRVVGISASERKADHTYASTFTEFQQKIAAVGLGHMEILQPIAYWDITFFDWSIWADDQMIELERNIHNVLFPRVDFNYLDFCNQRGVDPNNSKIDRKWRNRKCDVLAMWCHIYYNGDIFVTEDENFTTTKMPDLIVLGARDILAPKNALIKLNQMQP
jgi:hypothetical protein